MDENVANIQCCVSYITLWILTAPEVERSSKGIGTREIPSFSPNASGDEEQKKVTSTQSGSEKAAGGCLAESYATGQ